MLTSKERRFFGRLLSSGGILAYFVIAAEFIIMISPFAFFFYSVFNPLFQALSATPRRAGSWLSICRTWSTRPASSSRS